MSVPPPGPDSSEDEPFEEAEARRRSARPLVWLLLVIAALAVVWYLSRSPGPELVSGPVPPAAAPGPVDEAQDEADPSTKDGSPDATPGTIPPDPVESAGPPADRAAEPLARVQPEYPREALRLREEGTVLLRVEVDAQGKATAVEIESSSRSRTLDRAAREAVSKWTFRPAIEGGRPVASTVTVPVDFSVE